MTRLWQESRSAVVVLSNVSDHKICRTEIEGPATIWMDSRAGYRQWPRQAFSKCDVSQAL
jgi:hypothetical protein